VKSGFIRLPEIPATLLPVEGESLLLAAGVDSLLLTDSPRPATTPANEGPVLGESKGGFLPDLDVNLKLPGNLMIHGYGLNVELQGDLKVSRGCDEDGIPTPVMDGLVEVHTGSLKFMNRVFAFNRAEVQFNGLAPPDPQLAVSLEAQVGAYRVRIEVRGAASDPEIILVAEPELSQTDVMALLLFGQPATDLDTSQRGRMSEEENPGKQLQQNLAALAVVFGTSGMQNTMSSTLGVDMVEFGAGTKGDSTLMVGKFITPRILVKYNQSLEKSGTYFMRILVTDWSRRN